MSLASIFSFLFFVVKSLHVQQIEEQDVTLFANWVMKLVKMSLYWINIGPKSSNLHPYKTNVIHTEGDHVTQSQRLERCSNKPINVKDTRSLQKLEEERNFFFFFLELSQGKMALLTSCFGLLVSKSVRINFVTQSHHFQNFVMAILGN